MLRFQLVILAALPFVSAACAGGGSAIKDPARDTTRQISADELSRMVLQLAQLPSEYAGLDPSKDNGLVTMDRAAAGFDPSAERADLEKFGWASGYDASYSDPTAGQRPGVSTIESELYVFSSVDGASGYLEASANEIAANVGKTSNQITINEVNQFEAVVADKATGLRTKITAQAGGSNYTYEATSLAFSRGRLFGVVSIVGSGLSATEEQALIGRVEGLAHTLNDNIASVLAGPQ